MQSPVDVLSRHPTSSLFNAPHGDLLVRAVQIGLVDEYLPSFPRHEFGLDGIDEVDVVHEGRTQQSRGSGADVMLDTIHAKVVADRGPHEVG